MRFDRPVNLLKYDEDTQEWKHIAYNMHAFVNKTGGSEYLSSGAYQSKATLTFEFRYSGFLSKVFLNTQLYRLEYCGAEYDIEDYDDYQEKHQTIRLLGVARGV